MYCKKCGKFIDDDAIYCSNCGEKVNSSLNNDSINNSSNMNKSKRDSETILLSILCGIIPVVGLVLFLAWQEKEPERSMVCGKAALIGSICYVTIGVITSIVRLIFFSVGLVFFKNKIISIVSMFSAFYNFN